MSPKGLAVPNGGTNLIQITLSPSAAVGRFDLVLLTTLNGFPMTGWTTPPSYAVPPNWGAYGFDIVSLSGRPAGVVASVVFGDAPEPSTGFMLASAVAGLMFIVAYKRLRGWPRLLAHRGAEGARGFPGSEEISCDFIAPTAISSYLSNCDSSAIADMAPFSNNHDSRRRRI